MISLDGALTLLSVALWSTRYRWVPRAGLLAFALGLAAFAVAEAETPFGIGDGVVPDLRGDSLCVATQRLAARGPRWRNTGGRVHASPACENSGCG